MSAFVLKIIAVVTMFMDHLGYIVFGKVSFLNCIGRLAFPIFAFQISEGYSHTRNLKKYFVRLLIFAVISQIPYTLFISTYRENIFYPNIFFTLILGLLSITIYENFKKKNKNLLENNHCLQIPKEQRNYKISIQYYFNAFLGVFIPLVIMFLSELLHFDYGFFGVALIFLFHIFKNKKLLINILYILLVSIDYIIKIIEYPTYIYLRFYIFTLIPIIFINLYNEKKGKDSKYFLYFFYPLHLILLYLLSLI